MIICTFLEEQGSSRAAKALLSTNVDYFTLCFKLIQYSPLELLLPLQVLKKTKTKLLQSLAQMVWESLIWND